MFPLERYIYRSSSQPILIRHGVLNRQKAGNLLAGKPTNVINFMKFFGIVNRTAKFSLIRTATKELHIKVV